MDFVKYKKYINKYKRILIELGKNNFSNKCSKFLLVPRKERQIEKE